MCEQHLAVVQLQSADLREVAWGAYGVAQRRLRAAVPEVRAALARVAGSVATDAGHCTALAVLDALVRIDATVPAAEIVPFAPFGAPVLVLAARDPAANRPVLRALFGSPRAPWLDAESAFAGGLLLVRSTWNARRTAA